MSCVCKIKCIHWNAAILLYFFCFIFIFMTTLTSSKPISNICRACKLSNLAQQLGEGEGGGEGVYTMLFQTQDQMGCTKTYVSPTLFFQTKFYCKKRINVSLWYTIYNSPQTQDSWVQRCKRSRKEAGAHYKTCVKTKVARRNHSCIDVILKIFKTCTCNPQLCTQIVFNLSSKQTLLKLLTVKPPKTLTFSIPHIVITLGVPNQLSLWYKNAVDLQFPYGYTVHVLEFTKL